MANGRGHLSVSAWPPTARLSRPHRCHPVIYQRWDWPRFPNFVADGRKPGTSAAIVVCAFCPVRGHERDSRGTASRTVGPHSGWSRCLGKAILGRAAARVHAPCMQHVVRHHHASLPRCHRHPGKVQSSTKLSQMQRSADEDSASTERVGMRAHPVCFVGRAHREGWSPRSSQRTTRRTLPRGNRMGPICVRSVKDGLTRREPRCIKRFPCV